MHRANTKHILATARCAQQKNVLKYQHRNKMTKATFSNEIF